MKNRIMNLLLAITFMFIILFGLSCLQGGDKHYWEWEPTEAEKKEIIEEATKKMIEQQEKN